jgi:hypothetical protein
LPGGTKEPYGKPQRELLVSRPRFESNIEHTHAHIHTKNRPFLKRDESFSTDRKATKIRKEGVNEFLPTRESIVKHIYIYIYIHSGTLVCEHNSLRKRACNPKHSYIKANFPIRNNGNSDDSFQN